MSALVRRFAYWLGCTRRYRGTILGNRLVVWGRPR